MEINRRIWWTKIEKSEIFVSACSSPIETILNIRVFEDWLKGKKGPAINIDEIWFLLRRPIIHSGMVKWLIDVAENVKKATDKRRSEARFSRSKGPFLSPFDYAWGIFEFILRNLWYIWQVSSRILIRGLKISGGMIETEEDSSRKKFNKRRTRRMYKHRTRYFYNYLLSREKKKIHEQFSYLSLNKNRKESKITFFDFSEFSKLLK